MNILITGPKASGKTTTGREVAAKLGLRFLETDTLIEELHRAETGETRTFREIYRLVGETSFRELEMRAVEKAASVEWAVIATGGGTMLNPAARAALSPGSILVFIRADDDLLWERITGDGVPDFFGGDDGPGKMRARNALLAEAVVPLAQIVVDAGPAEAMAEEIVARVIEIIPLMMRAPSTFGEVIRVTTFGESHGPALGAVLEGVKAGIDISPEDLQRELDRRRPGQSAVTTGRNEADEVSILSGVFEGKTTGAPICMIVYNRDQDSSRYDALRDLFRPGHADFTFYRKYGVRDHRGGGRSSGRETVSRVVSGAVAKRILASRGIRIFAYAEEIAGIRGDRVDLSFIEKNPVRAADPARARDMEEAVIGARKEGDSVGGVVRLLVPSPPAGLGDPVFFKLDARLGMAFFSIGAVKGVEFGAGFAAASMRGSENNDPMADGAFLTNNAGGILGGISTGADITARIAVKPTPSIFREQRTIDVLGRDRSLRIEGRHDPCIVPRIIPVIEAMAALVLLDAMEINERIR